MNERVVGVCSEEELSELLVTLPRFIRAHKEVTSCNHAYDADPAAWHCHQMTRYDTKCSSRRCHNMDPNDARFSFCKAQYLFRECHFTQETL
ncbi:hypothetical protein H257_14178 [Aphanomyces astaci]|uniref:Uncharacterized protein n=1 Tax=Aphanomyces astaci TaxID=112090 RepID=W4FRZ5_APHAT|nr:hypothetical protein H257_14178 [Aphanomyces astaci]ETV70275.1 hypothetical protein H257_14178 [Aphanomyces astaci]|eukprot:XP_009840234.1 hypothetical protein H257_14178 [Aphanomyces astaci]